MLESAIAALAALRSQDAGPLSQGLSAENAAACLHQAIRPLNPTSLRAAVEAAGPIPPAIAIVVSSGVFTTPIEWTAIAVSAGCSVHLKAPASDPALCRALAEVFTANGADVTWGVSRELPPVDAIIAFGGDQSVADVASANPTVPVEQYGHRFSVAWVAGDAVAAAGPLAIDLVRYDGRGCMAPTAVFTPGDPDELAEAIAGQLQELEQRFPRGAVDPSLGPEWRRRLGLARVVGSSWTGSEWAVTVTPPKYFTPAALPRMVNIHPASSIDELRAILAPWRPWLSTLGTDADGISIDGVHRVCRLGWMQAPSIPRHHDGRPMLYGLNRPPGG